MITVWVVSSVGSFIVFVVLRKAYSFTTCHHNTHFLKLYQHYYHLIFCTSMHLPALPFHSMRHLGEHLHRDVAVVSLLRSSEVLALGR